MYKLDLERAEEPELKLPTSIVSLKNERVPENICFIDYAKSFDCVYHNKLWKILQEMGIPEHLTCLLRNLYTEEATLEADMEQWTGSKLWKDYIEAVYCHSAY